MTTPNIVSGLTAGGATNSPRARYDRATGARLGAQETVEVSFVTRPIIAVLALDTQGEIPLCRSTVVGRRPPAGPYDTVFVVDPSPALSCAHLRLDFEGWEATVMDLGSRNGTWHRRADRDWSPLSPNIPVSLDSGDCLWFAGTTAVLHHL